jgi:hypothetical protein
VLPGKRDSNSFASVSAKRDIRIHVNNANPTKILILKFNEIPFVGSAGKAHRLVLTLERY